MKANQKSCTSRLRPISRLVLRQWDIDFRPAVPNSSENSASWCAFSHVRGDILSASPLHKSRYVRIDNWYWFPYSGEVIIDWGWGEINFRQIGQQGIEVICCCHVWPIRAEWGQRITFFCVCSYDSGATSILISTYFLGSYNEKGPTTRMQSPASALPL